MKIVLLVLSIIALLITIYMNMTTVGKEKVEYAAVNNHRASNWLGIAAILYWMSINA